MSIISKLLFNKDNNIRIDKKDKNEISFQSILEYEKKSTDSILDKKNSNRIILRIITK